MNIIECAKEVVEIESREISSLSERLSDDFEGAVNSILHRNQGKLIVSGMGKSGIIGRKIAATFASTGTPSFFLHPGEAYHGDLGMIEKQDTVLLISNSGETEEVLKLVPFLIMQNNLIISMSGNPESTLAKNSEYHLNIRVDKEACPLQLAPTNSTTATLVMGDALAVTLMKMKGFKDEDFAEFHPGGNLGKRLLTTVDSVMKADNLPICNPTDGLIDVTHAISSGGCGIVVLVEENKICGVVTDGDLRRTMEYRGEEFFDLRAKDIMNVSPRMILSTSKLEEAKEMMFTNKVTALLVVDEKQELLGLVQMYNLEMRL